MTTSPMRSSPDVMSSRPTIMRSSVDFPQPDGPTRIMNSPSAMSRLTSFTAWYPSGYFLLTFLMVMAAISRELLRAGGRTSALDGAGGEAGHDAALEDQRH